MHRSLQPQESIGETYLIGLASSNPLTEALVEQLRGASFTQALRLYRSVVLVYHSRHVDHTHERFAWIFSFEGAPDDDMASPVSVLVILLCAAGSAVSDRDWTEG